MNPYLEVDIIGVACDQPGEGLSIGALDVQQVIQDVQDQGLRSPTNKEDYH